MEVTRQQFPFVNCWACTIHKAQGRSEKEIVIHLDKSMAKDALAYVALSRCKHLEGVHLTSLNSKAFKTNKNVAAEYARLTKYTKDCCAKEKWNWPKAIYGVLLTAAAYATSRFAPTANAKRNRGGARTKYQPKNIDVSDEDDDDTSTASDKSVFYFHDKGLFADTDSDIGGDDYQSCYSDYSYDNRDEDIDSEMGDALNEMLATSDFIRNFCTCRDESCPCRGFCIKQYLDSDTKLCEECTKHRTPVELLSKLAGNCSGVSQLLQIFNKRTNFTGGGRGTPPPPTPLPP